jgi:hypothetical protein
VRPPLFVLGLGGQPVTYPFSAHPLAIMSRECRRRWACPPAARPHGSRRFGRSALLCGEFLHGARQRSLAVDGHGYRQLRTMVTHPHPKENAAQGRVGSRIYREHLADELAVAQLGSPVPSGPQ